MQDQSAERDAHARFIALLTPVRSRLAGGVVHCFTGSIAEAEAYLALDLQATSQLAFPDDATSAVYNSALYVAKGQNPTSPNRDGIFSDGVTYQLATVAQNAATGGYDAQLTVGIAA